MKKVLAAFAAAAIVPMVANAWSITATGTIYNDVYGVTHNGDGANLFGGSASLVGMSYIETITTNPLENPSTDCASASCQQLTGNVPLADPSAGSAASYTITTTVNGVTFSQTINTPTFNTSILMDGLSTGQGPEDRLGQTAQADCNTGPCISGYIQAISDTTTFVPTVDYNQSWTLSQNLGSPNAQAYFSDATGNGTTQFWGSIDSLQVNQVQQTADAPVRAFAAFQPAAAPTGVPEPDDAALLLVSLVCGGGIIWHKTKRVSV